MKVNPYAQYSKCYKIHTTKNQKYVWDVSGHSDPTKRGRLQLCQFHGGENQQFFLTPSSSGLWKICCLKTSDCLQIKQDSQGAYLYFGPSQNIPSQEWELVRLKQDVYFIKDKQGLVIDVPGGKYKDEAQLILYGQHGGDNQQWVLEVISKSK